VSTLKQDQISARFKGEPTIVGVFESMNELLDAATAAGNKRTQGYWDDQSADWYGLYEEFVGKSVSVKEVARIINEGWNRGAEKLMKALSGLSDIQVKPVSIKRARRWAEQGDSVDMPRVYAGRLDAAWQQCYRAKRVSPAKITIVCDSIESGGNNAETMFWRGAAVVVLADKLQTAGYNVEVISSWTGRYAGLRRVACYVTVKQADQPLDVTTLSSAVACPAFFRCIGHCWGNIVDGHLGGYSVDRWVPADGEIMATHDRRWDATTARKWVEEQIAKLEEQQEAA
jgi:hypothetical protein